jgi:hypothetical protein
MHHKQDRGKKVEEEIEKLRKFIEGLESKLVGIASGHGLFVEQIMALRDKQALLLELEAMEAEKQLWRPSL